MLPRRLHLQTQSLRWVINLETLAKAQAHTHEHSACLQSTVYFTQAKGRSHTHLQTALGAFTSTAYCLCFVCNKCAWWVCMESACKKAKFSQGYCMCHLYRSQHPAELHAAVASHLPHAMVCMVWLLHMWVLQLMTNHDCHIHWDAMDGSRAYRTGPSVSQPAKSSATPNGRLCGCT